MRSVGLLTFDRDCLQYYTRQFRAAFERAGIACRVYDLCEGRTRQHLADLFAAPPDCLMGVSCIAAEPILLSIGYEMRAIQEEQPELLCDRLERPYISYHIDPPLQYFHHQYSRFSCVAHIDEVACDILREVATDRVLFLPYGADPLLREEDDKEYDVVFLASCYDYEAIARVWPRHYPPHICRFMREVAEEALARYDLPLLQIFGNALRAAGLFLDPKHVPQIYCHIENYLRGRERVEMVRSLRGLSVHLFGGQVDVDNIVITKGWKEYLSDCPWVTLHPTVSYEESLRIMSRSKVLLNSSPQFRGGAHDRVVNGMACGAVVCTNDNPFMRRHFDGGREVCLFQYGRWRDLKEEIQSMLAQEGRRKEIASFGREKVLAAHTWDHRVRDLVAAFPSLLQKTGVCV